MNSVLISKQEKNYNSNFKEEKKINEDSNKFVISMRKGSSSKVRPSAPIVKKNIFGYYEEPQFSCVKSTLTKTIPYTPKINKCIQTTP